MQGNYIELDTESDTNTLVRVWGGGLGRITNGGLSTEGFHGGVPHAHGTECEEPVGNPAVQRRWPSQQKHVVL